MTTTDGKSKVKRPTEETALARLSREASRLGISQVDLIKRYAILSTSHNTTCHCVFCRRKRAQLIGEQQAA